MKNHHFPWRKHCLVGLSSLYLGSAHATISVEHSHWEVSPQPVFSQLMGAPDSLLLSQRIERRDGSRLRDKKLRQRPDRLNNGSLFKQPAATVKQAAKMAQQQHGGKVLKVERHQQSYRVKMLRDGRVSYVKVPAH